MPVGTRSADGHAIRRSVDGPLAVVVKCQPEKGTSAQFFWASPGGGFNAVATNARALNPTDAMQEYLFRIGVGQPLGKLRFDPFSGVGEMRIESLTVYRLVE